MGEDSEMNANIIPNFIPQEIVRQYLSPNILSKYAMIDKITIASFIARLERTGKPIKTKVKNRYRMLDVLVRAKVDGILVEPVEKQKLLVEIKEMQSIHKELQMKLEYLQNRVQEERHRLELNEASVKLTGKTLLRTEEILSAKLNKTMMSGIYFLIQDNEIIYVGQSVNIFARIATHIEQKEFDSYAYLECPPEQLNTYESLYIHTLRPKLNGRQTHDKRVPMAPITLDKLLGFGFRNEQ